MRCASGVRGCKSLPALFLIFFYSGFFHWAYSLMVERVAHDDFMLVQFRLSPRIYSNLILALRGQYHNWQWACFENNHMWVQLLPAPVRALNFFKCTRVYVIDLMSRFSVCARIAQW